MNVKEAIALLQQCDPEAELVVNIPFGNGFQAANAIVRRANHGGVGMRYSTDEIKTVEVTYGDLPHMQGQGLDALGVVPIVAACTCWMCENRRLRLLRTQEAAAPENEKVEPK